MCFRYRPSEAGGAGGREAPGSSGQEEREEGETPHWHCSARWRGKRRPDVITNMAESSPAVRQEIFCETDQSRGLLYCQHLVLQKETSSLVYFCSDICVLKVGERGLSRHFLFVTMWLEVTMTRKVFTRLECIEVLLQNEFKLLNPHWPASGSVSTNTCHAAKLCSKTQSLFWAQVVILDFPKITNIEFREMCINIFINN